MHAPRDPVLAELVPRLSGLRPPLAPDPFESVVTSITAQQVSLRAAFAIRNRFIQRLGGQPSAPTASRLGRPAVRPRPAGLAPSASRHARAGPASALRRPR